MYWSQVQPIGYFWNLDGVTKGIEPTGSTMDKGTVSVGECRFETTRCRGVLTMPAFQHTKSLTTLAACLFLAMLNRLGVETG